MIIDEILDFKYFVETYGLENVEPDMKYIYDEATLFGFDYLAEALDNGDNQDIQKALCRYIDDNNYPAYLLAFINSINWQQYADNQS